MWDLNLSNTPVRKLYYWSGIFTCILAVLLLIFLVTHHTVSSQREVPAVIGGYCAILGAVLSFFQILEHLSCFTDPECQTKIVRILFMVPLYGLISWISILNPGAAEYLNLIRDAYESYAIYAFFSLMLALMGGTDTLYRTLMVETRDPIPHFFPFCWLEPVKVSPKFVQNCRLAIFQFMVMKPLVTFVILVLTAKDKMGTELFDLSHGYFWTTLVYNISITTAFTALVYFYQGTKDFLEGKQAFAKFLCIKAVIFLSFWQGVVIAILAALDVLPKFDYWTASEAAAGLQDFLLCIEMLFVAFGHKFCFGSDDYAIEAIAGTSAIGEDVHGPGGGVVPIGDLGDAGRGVGVAVAADAAGGSICSSTSDTTSFTGLTGPAASVSHGIAPRYVPPSRMSVWNNLLYTLRHEDLITEVGDIVHRR